MKRADVECAGVAANVSVARRFVRATLAGWGADRYAWAAEAIVSELATNAVIHARTAFRVSLHINDDALTIEVGDSSPLPPVRRRFEATATTGRGMRLVDDLSTRWFVTPAPGGKVITCVLARADSGGRLSDSEPSGAVVDIAALLAQIDDEGEDDRAANRGTRDAVVAHCASDSRRPAVAA